VDAAQPGAAAALARLDRQVAVLAASLTTAAAPSAGVADTVEVARAALGLSPGFTAGTQPPPQPPPAARWTPPSRALRPPWRGWTARWRSWPPA
jgi:hypothetical protein